MKDSCKSIPIICASLLGLAAIVTVMSLLNIDIRQVNAKCATTGSEPIKLYALDESKQLSPKDAHPHAAALMADSFYWSNSDENTPFGNDNGADTLSRFRKWIPQHREEKPAVFIKEVCESFQAPFREWNEINPSDLHTILDWKKSYVMTTGDDIIISAAFAQLMIEGTVDNSLKRLAFIAIGKEEAPNTIKSRGWINPEERKQRLVKLRSVLQAAKGKN